MIYVFVHQTSLKGITPNFADDFEKNREILDTWVESDQFSAEVSFGNGIVVSKAHGKLLGMLKRTREDCHPVLLNINDEMMSEQDVLEVLRSGSLDQIRKSCVLVWTKMNKMLQPESYSPPGFSGHDSALFNENKLDRADDKAIDLRPTLHK